MQIKFSDGIKGEETYILIIEAESDLHVNVLLSTDKSLNIMPDGIPIRFSFNTSESQ
jgi:hypothetical protein